MSLKGSYEVFNFACFIGNKGVKNIISMYQVVLITAKCNLMQ